MDERITDLEIKIAFVERHVTELDELVRTLYDAVERLQLEVASLAESAAAQGREGAKSLAEDKPPHY